MDSKVAAVHMPFLNGKFDEKYSRSIMEDLADSFSMCKQSHLDDLKFDFIRRDMMIL